MNDSFWRTWLYDRLRLTSPVVALVPEASIYGAGSLTAPPAKKPFIVITMGQDVPEFPGVSRQDATLWFHDEPGTYNRIDQIRQAVRQALCGPDGNTGPVAEAGAIACRWMADSGDQADEGYGTIVKTTDFQLVGRKGNG